MPILSPPAKILVTGANGFVGLWIVRTLLERGYAVRGAVRSEEKARKLAELIETKHPELTSAFESVVMPDITSEKAVESQLEGVQGIIHTATPVTFELEEPEDYIRPALDGTMGLLRRAAHHPDIKRVVVTSSIGAVAETILDETRVYTEDDWNEPSVQTMRRLGRKASGIVKYDASKVLAEQAAWKFYEENRATLPYDLVVVAPGWILGPLPDDPASPEALVTPSPILEWVHLFKDPPPEKQHPVVFNYVDIRDVTEMHIRALELPEAAGQRFLSISLVCTWQDWFNVAHEENILPGLAKLHPPAVEDKSAIPPHAIFSNAKAQKLLGITFKTIPETLRDIVADFAGRGWLKHLEAL
ncbi:NAD-P-binding protein [Trametes polyzona]|nr:NAD-P-binding protein [Trametes polyzona]